MDLRSTELEKLSRSTTGISSRSTKANSYPICFGTAWRHWLGAHAGHLRKCSRMPVARRLSRPQAVSRFLFGESSCGMTFVKNAGCNPPRGRN